MDIRTERLNKAFKASGLSQSELCDKADINKGALSSYLSGRYFPKQIALEKLSSVLNVSISYLMGFDVSTSESSVNPSSASPFELLCKNRYGKALNKDKKPSTRRTRGC